MLKIPEHIRKNTHAWSFFSKYICDVFTTAFRLRQNTVPNFTCYFSAHVTVAEESIERDGNSLWQRQFGDFIVYISALYKLGLFHRQCNTFRSSFFVSIVVLFTFRNWLLLFLMFLFTLVLSSSVYKIVAVRILIQNSNNIST